MNAIHFRGLFFVSTIIGISGCTNLPSAPSVPPVEQTENAAPVENAKRAFTEGDYARAIQLFEPLVASDSASEETVFFYAESLRLKGDSAQAISAYDRVLAKNPDALHALEGKALSLVREGKLELATEALTTIVQEDGTRWRTINALGITYALMGKYEEANEYFTMARAVSHDNPVIAHNEALALAMRGNYAEAETALRTLSIDKTLNEAQKKQVMFNLALVLGMQGKLEEAEKILATYLTPAAIANNLGVYAALSKQPSLAKGYWSEAVSLSPVFYETAWKNLEDRR